jgi:S-adenosylmethionine-dependent methyltransferase
VAPLLFPRADEADRATVRAVTETVTGAGPATAGGPVQAALRAEVDRVRAARPDRPPQVLDVGGGSGGWAVPLARLGCAVTVVDHSPNALAALDRRARGAGVDHLVAAVQGDVDALAEVAPPGGADLVLGHGLLEVVDDAAAAVDALRLAAAPGGAVSVLVAGRYAAVLARTLSGKLAEARAVLTDPDGRFGPDDALRRRLDAAALHGLLEAGDGLRVELLQGDGVLDAWVPGAVRDDGPSAARSVAELERLAAGAAPLRDVATRLHALARRPR